MEILHNHFIGHIGMTKPFSEKVYEQKEMIYSGQLKSDQKINALGKLFISDTESSFVYNGAIVNNQMNGDGYLVYISNQLNPTYKSYKGSFKNNQFDGQGTIMFTNGDVFIGNFSQGKKHGSGKMYNSNGDLIMNNIWKNDIVCGKVEYVEYYHGTKDPKIVGQLNNSVKVGHWIHIRDDKTIERIDYYEQNTDEDNDLDAENPEELDDNPEELDDNADEYEDEVSEKTIKNTKKSTESTESVKSVKSNRSRKNSKTDKQINSSEPNAKLVLHTHPSGYIMTQRLNFEIMPSNEELCMGTFKYFDDKLNYKTKNSKEDKSNINNLDKGVDSGSGGFGGSDGSYYEELSNIAIKSNIQLETDHTMYLYLGTKGNKLKITEIVNGIEYPRIVYLDESENKSKKFFVSNIVKHSDSVVVDDSCSLVPPYAGAIATEFNDHLDVNCAVVHEEIIHLPSRLKVLNTTVRSTLSRLVHLLDCHK
jgi:hypothetical protein